jgi:RNA polymerase sigma-70 factor (ECF subfamily)
MINELKKPRDLSLVPSPMTRDEEICLATRAGGGDRSAQRRVVMLILSRVRSIIAYMVNDAAWAEDLTQSVMIKILSSLKDYRGESSLEFWSNRIAIRMTMKAVKTKRRRKQLLFFLPEPESPFAEVQGAVTAGELRHHINQIVSKLSEKQQTAIRLRYIHEYNIKEIAEMTEVPENTVRDRLRVGKKRLKTLLDKNPAVRGWILRGKS